MGAWTKRIALAALLAAGLHHFLNRGDAKPRKKPAVVSLYASRSFLGCLQLADAANDSLRRAGRAVSRAQLEPEEWQGSSEHVRRAIAEAEEACSGGETEMERMALREVQGALGSMRESAAYLGRVAASEEALTASAGQQCDRLDERLDRARAMVQR